MAGHTIAITGANRGIGLEMARIFAERGDRVIALCRKASETLQATGAQIVENVEVTSIEALRSCAWPEDAPHIDVLINNAGILTDEDFDSLDQPHAIDQLKRQHEVNAIGPLLVTRMFADRLKQGSKVALITSRMGSIDDNDSGGRYGYRMSKAALNAGGKSLAVDLAPRGISVGILHPGAVRTEMTGGRGQVDAPDAARMLVERIDELGPETSGEFRHANGETLPW
ncbi:MAG: SDR family oxidoreductase [Halofilum sp. (in: g-proteobacteria)]